MPASGVVPEPVSKPAPVPSAAVLPVGKVAVAAIRSAQPAFLSTKKLTREALLPFFPAGFEKLSSLERMELIDIIRGVFFQKKKVGGCQLILATFLL